MSEVAAAIAAAAPPAAAPPVAPPAGAPPVVPPAADPPAAPQFPDWMTTLPEELRTNEKLARYKSHGDLAKGLLETEAWARGRVALPKDGDDASFNEFATKLRPENAEGYGFKVDEGQDGTMTDWFKGAAFDAGLHPRQANALMTGWNQHMADLTGQAQAKGRDELKAIELENPVAYARTGIAIESMMRAAGIQDFSGVNGLESAIGAGATFKMLAMFAEKTGELAKVDGEHVKLSIGATSAADAQKEITRMFADPAIRANLGNPQHPDHIKYQQLTARVAQGDR